MLNAVKSMLADVSSVSSSSEQRRHLKIVIFIRFRMVNGQNRWVHINRPSRRIIFRWPSAKPFIWKLVSIHTCEKGLAFVFALKTSRHFELRQTRARRGEEQVQLSAAESVETVAVSSASAVEVWLATCDAAGRVWSMSKDNSVGQWRSVCPLELVNSASFDAGS